MRELGLPHIGSFAIPPAIHSAAGVVVWREGSRQQAFGALKRGVDALREELGEPIAYNEAPDDLAGLSYACVYWPAQREVAQ